MTYKIRVDGVDGFDLSTADAFKRAVGDDEAQYGPLIAAGIDQTGAGQDRNWYVVETMGDTPAGDIDIVRKGDPVPGGMTGIMEAFLSLSGDRRRYVICR